jgi:uncharacterized protein (TIGR03083 family)
VAGFSAGFDDVAVALRTGREQLIALTENLAPDDWQRPSRCEVWTVHDVVRHVRDICRLHVTELRGEAHATFDEPFDNRTTPARWLERTSGESPRQTVDDLRALAAEEAHELAARVQDKGRQVIPGPYGPVHWTVLVAHIAWDGWLHERDVTEPLGRPRPSTPAEEAVVSTYGLLIASLPALQAKYSFGVTVALSGGDGRTYIADVAPARVTLRDGNEGGPADLRGDVEGVVDALSGRGADVESVLAGDAQRREPLTWLRPRLRPC